MVLPAYKVISLVIRTFSKPLISFTKEIHLKQGPSHPKIRNTFIRIGNSYHSWQRGLNMSILGLKKKDKYEPINDDLAIEKGIELSYQILMYGIIIGFSLYEFWQNFKESRQKKKHLEATIKKSQSSLQNLLDEIAKYEIQIQQQNNNQIANSPQENTTNSQQNSQKQAKQEDKEQEQEQNSIDVILDVLDEVLEEYIDEE